MGEVTVSVPRTRSPDNPETRIYLTNTAGSSPTPNLSSFTETKVMSNASKWAPVGFGWAYSFTSI